MLNPLQLSFDFISDLTRAITRSERAQPPATVPPMNVGDAGSARGADPQQALTYELRRSPRRRLLSIEVHPDLRVIVRAPLRCAERDVARFLAERARWIEAQLAHFRRQPSSPPGPSYGAGETHLYFGLARALVLLPDEPAGVRVAGDSLLVCGRAARQADSVRTALTAWYRERAAIEFAAMLDACHQHPRFSRYPRPVLHIRAMRTRWGSLGPHRGMTLNLALIQAPPACIEYVVMHELCHLRYRGHGKRFYRLLDAVLPDWRARKRTLEETIR